MAFLSASQHKRGPPRGRSCPGLLFSPDTTTTPSDPRDGPVQHPILNPNTRAHTQTHTQRLVFKHRPTADECTTHACTHTSMQRNCTCMDKTRRLCTRTRTHTHKQTHTNNHTHMPSHTNPNTHTRTHTHTRAHTHTRTHIHRNNNHTEYQLLYHIAVNLVKELYRDRGKSRYSYRVWNGLT